MILKGKLYAVTPIYRGNARKTLFTRDGDGRHRLVSLAGEISGTAQALMDAFIGQSRNGKNIGLLNQLWGRMYGKGMPDNLIQKVECKLQKESYPRNNFFDMRMGIRLNEDRWASEANANYKMETVLRNSAFELVLTINDGLLKKNENQARLFYLLEEMKAERFWFGAGKSKGLGRLRLEMKLPFPAPEAPPALSGSANHLRVEMTINAQNPMLVGWNWGKIDPHVPSFAAVEAKNLIGAMRGIPEDIRNRLEMALGGPILNPDDWKKKFADTLPRVIAIWLREQAAEEAEFWILPEPSLKKLGKGKYGLSKKLLKALEPLTEKPFPSQEVADEAFQEALGKKANMSKRVVDLLEHQQQTQRELDRDAWREIADGLGMAPELKDKIAGTIDDEAELTKALQPAVQAALPGIYEQVDQHIKMLQSDAWVDMEIESREEHMRIKEMLKAGEISEDQWNDPKNPPENIRPAAWREFLEAHSRVAFRFMRNPGNLNKSIINDHNQIEFLKTYRERTRQELSQPEHVDFRAGGQGNREISRKYGKPYDTVFMRMLTWGPASTEDGTWETYIPGSTLKGAFRKRAAQVLKTVQGEGGRTDSLLDRLFGRQGQRGLILFSDAYLTDPKNTARAWCSMDGIKVNPRTGQPIESAKQDYLYAYGKDLVFRFQADLQDVDDRDLDALTLFFYLLKDFQAGDIPLGGEKTSGFGWVQAEMEKMTWLTGDPGGFTQTLFGKRSFRAEGAWQALELSGTEAADALTPKKPLPSGKPEKDASPPVAQAGFVSHRAFGGYCGSLSLTAEVLTPVNIRESGEPSFTKTLDEGPVNGWDFFSMAPPEADRRPDERRYAIPGRSIKGMIRHIYAIAANARKESSDISQLNPADSLFGWVGEGQNQALMGRLVFEMAPFDAPEMAWFKAPYPYGNWRHTGKGWQERAGSSAERLIIDDRWRLFPHAPLAPLVEQAESFDPDTVQASYFRAILPGSKARFSIRFWNLSQEEFQRLIWCLILEPGMAHKLGNNRYLGFGSVRFSLEADSFFIDWQKRYAGESEEKWRLPIKVAIDPNVIQHYDSLRRALNAEQI